MRDDGWDLTRDPDEFARAARALGASVNVAILRELAGARRKGDGWMYLSQIAEALGESPGTVGAGVQKLAPFVEEKREKGLRWFRARFVELRLEARRARE